MEKLKELKKFFERDRFVKANGIEIIKADGESAICKASVVDNHLNANDAVQGGMLYTIADFTFAVLANHLHPITVTQSASISYINACKNTAYITAEAREISRTNHNSVVEVIVKDERDTIVAIGMFNGFIR